MKVFFVFCSISTSTEEGMCVIRLQIHIAAFARQTSRSERQCIIKVIYWDDILFYRVVVVVAI